ncbi:MAG: DinB family protein [Dehalococcoidia bacterium]
MGKAQELADRFEQVNNEVIAAVESCPDDKWQDAASGEERQVNVVAHHIASSHGPIAGLVKAIAEGGELPALTGDMIDAGNAEHAKTAAGVSKSQTIELLRSGGREAADSLRGLSDEQLAKTGSMPLFGDQPWSAQDAIERVLIGHPQGHLGSIKG